MRSWIRSLLFNGPAIVGVSVFVVWLRLTLPAPPALLGWVRLLAGGAAALALLGLVWHDARELSREEMRRENREEEESP